MTAEQLLEEVFELLSNTDEDGTKIMLNEAIDTAMNMIGDYLSSK